MTVGYRYVRIDTREEVSAKYVYHDGYGRMFIRECGSILLDPRSPPHDGECTVQVFQDVPIPRTLKYDEYIHNPICKTFNFNGMQVYELVNGEWVYLYGY